MLSCRDFVRLTSSNQNERQSWTHRAGLRLHALVCKHCKNYLRQLGYLKAGIGRLLRSRAQASTAEIEEIKRTIVDKISNK